MALLPTEDEGDSVSVGMASSVVAVGATSSVILGSTVLLGLGCLLLFVPARRYLPALLSTALILLPFVTSFVLLRLRRSDAKQAPFLRFVLIADVVAIPTLALLLVLLISGLAGAIL